MNVNSRNTLAQNWLEKAKKRYAAAEMLYNSDMIGDAATKLYYAVYSTLRALLTVDDIAAKDGKSIVKHSTLISQFNKNYIHEKKVFPVAYTAYIKKTEELRIDEDYGDMVPIQKEIVQSYLEKFPEFYTSLSNYVIAQINEQKKV